MKYFAIIAILVACFLAVGSAARAYAPAYAFYVPAGKFSAKIFKFANWAYSSFFLLL